MLRPMTAAPTARKRSIAPQLEALEGRRLLAAKVTPQVTVQELETSPGSGSYYLLVTGTRRNDSILVTDNGKQAPGSLMVSANGVVSYISQRPSTSVAVVTGAGKDRVVYELQGDLRPDALQNVVVASSGRGIPATRSIAGGGSLQVTVNVVGKVSKGATLFVLATPDPKGATALALNAPGAIDGTLFAGLTNLAAPGGKRLGPTTLDVNSTAAIAATGQLRVGVQGGSSRNVARINYSGANNGDIAVSATGSGAKDSLAAVVNMAAGSTGTVGRDATSTVGGFGRAPDVRFLIARGLDTRTKTGINALIQATSRRSVAVHTPNVISLVAGSDSVVA